MSKKIILLLLLVAIAIVFYFSWLPDSTFANETYLPQWLLNWCNHYYNLRTAVPFLAIGFLLEAYTQIKDSDEISFDENLNLIQNIGISIIIVCIAEGGQFMLQKRSQDLMDVFYGIIGSLVGVLVYNLYTRLTD
jgi:uncharacterized membrane protein YidH (DUF202 family)